MRRLLIIVGVITLLCLGLITILSFVAPESSPITLLQNRAEDSACLHNTDDRCYAIPQVSGVTVDEAEITFPDAFAGTDYTLVVLPFDEQQQQEIAGWLPLFSELAGDNIGFYSLAPLPDSIAPIFRAAILLGVSATVRDPEIRPLLVFSFLEDQAAFINAIGATDNSIAQVLIVDSSGIIFYRDTGTFTPAKGAAFREALSTIQDR